MEPSSVEDGNRPGMEQYSHAAEASMEPSSVEDGNTDQTVLVCRLNRTLQWSRPQLRTETWTRRRMLRHSSGASMEPSSVEDGNYSQQYSPFSVATRFNGAVLS